MLKSKVVGNQHYFVKQDYNIQEYIFKSVYFAILLKLTEPKVFADFTKRSFAKLTDNEKRSFLTIRNQE